MEIEIEPLLQSLRRLSTGRLAGREVELTGAIAKVAQADELFCAGFAALVLKASREPSNAAREHAEAFPDLTGRTYCVGQPRFGIGASADRCDLLFSSDETSHALAVEVKLDADYQPDQVRRYLADLQAQSRGRAGLLVITARSHEALHTKVTANRQWLGEVRWSTLVRLGLGEISFASRNQALANCWCALVEALDGDPDFGLRSLSTRFEAWGRRGESGPGAAIFLLEECVGRVREELDTRLEPYGIRATPEHAAGRVTGSKGGYAWLTFRLGRTSARLKLLLRPATVNDVDDGPYMRVDFSPRERARRYHELVGPVSKDIRLGPAVDGAELCETLLVQWRAALAALDGRDAFRSTRLTPPVLARTGARNSEHRGQ